VRTEGSVGAVGIVAGAVRGHTEGELEGVGKVGGCGGGEGCHWVSGQGVGAPERHAAEEVV
jgi:hypothetical protein